jgi:hypothetical protein
LRILDFVIWVERGGIRGDVQIVWTMKVGCTERNGRSVLDLEVQMRRAGQDAIVGGRVGQGESTGRSELHVDALDMMMA